MKYSAEPPYDHEKFPQDCRECAKFKTNTCKVSVDALAQLHAATEQCRKAARVLAHKSLLKVEGALTVYTAAITIALCNSSQLTSHTQAAYTTMAPQ